MVRSGQLVVAQFTTRVASTGAGTAADSLPTAKLVVNGTDNAATVTVTNVTANEYNASVTLPALTPGQLVQIRAAATVSGVSDSDIVWSDTATLALPGRWAISSAITTPATADLFVDNGFYPANSATSTPCYIGLSSGWFIWYNGSGYTLSSALGTNGSSYWTAPTVTGTWTAAGSASGTPAFTALGATVLSGFQPDQLWMGNSDGSNYLQVDEMLRVGATPPTTAQIVTAIWEDLTAGGDFGTANSIGKLLVTGTPTWYTTPPTAAAIVTALLSDLTSSSDFNTSGSLGALFKANLDTNIGSRLATAGYTAPPTAAQIATAIFTDLTSSGDFATANSIGKLLVSGTPTWYTTPPTAAAIVTALLSDLTSSSDFNTSGSLGALFKANLDTNIGSRLATAGYTAPPTAAQIATAIFTDLTSSGDFATANSIGKLLVSGTPTWYTTPPTAAAIVTALLSDLTSSSDFNTSGSLGALFKANLDTNIGSRLATAGYTAPPTTAAIATAILTDTAAGDFETAGSLGSLFTGVGTSSMKYTTVALDNAPSGGGGGGGGTITISQAAAAAGETPIPAGQIQWLRGTSISEQLTGLGSLSGVTKLYFTAKPVGQNVADSAAAIQMEMTAGVITIAGRTYATPTDGSITVNDSTLGAITIALEPAASALLPLGTFAYDIKTITSGGVVADLTQGTLIVTATPTGAYR